jgi:U1 small nuclear ribonucleoprotein 70kDa
MIYRAFNGYGPIRSVRIVEDVVTGEPKGYALVEYEHEKDCLKAYKVLRDPI